MLMRIAFQKAKFYSPLQEVRDGEEAIAYLKGEEPYGDRSKFPLPIVMILDLNMPRQNGFDVLSWIQTQPDLKHLSVIVLTTSARPEDVRRAFDLGANSFLVKPPSLEKLVTMIQSLRDWLQINHFPPLNEMVKRR